MKKNALQQFLSMIGSVVALSLLLAPATLQAEVVVIANKDNSVTSLSRDDIYRIYMGKMKFLPNGAKVVPVDQRVGSPARDQFYSEILHKSDSEMRAYWSRIIFTGQGNPPIQESDDASVVATVSSNKDCVGYVDKSAANDNVKIVYTI